MIKNKLSRSISELEGTRLPQLGDTSYGRVSILAQEMKKFFTVSEKELSERQNEYFNNLKIEALQRDIYHKELLLVILQATNKKKFGEQNIKEKVRKKTKRDLKKEEKPKEPTKKDKKPDSKTETPPPAPKPQTPPAQTPPAPKPQTPPAPKPTVKKVEPASNVPSTATPTAPAISGAAKTATKVASVATVATAALTGREALAANIAKFESKGSAGRSFGGDEYNAYNKGTVGNKMIGATEPIDFSKMTISEYLRRSKLPKNDPNRLFAVGRYQIIPKTMEGLIKQLRIDPDTTFLTPTTQDHLFSKGLIDINRKKVSDYIEGRTSGIDARNEAIMELAKEFASIGVPYDTHRIDNVREKDGSVKRVRVELKKGSSFYAGIGGNKAHNPPELVAAALEEDRAKRIKVSPAEIPKNIGQNIEETSRQNKDMKKDMSKTPAGVVILQQNNNTTKQETNMISPNRQDNTNPILR
jgi:hypothetical protein